MSDAAPYKEEYLTVREHMDHDKHYIGDTLPVPTADEIAASGVTTVVGNSPIPARADHRHDVRLLYGEYFKSPSQSVASGAAAYITGIQYSRGYQYFDGASTQLFKFPIEGYYELYLHYLISRSSGGFPANIPIRIRFDYINGTSPSTVLERNHAEARGLEFGTLVQRVIFTSVDATTNVQVLYENFDSVAHNFFMVVFLITRLGSAVNGSLT